MPTYATLQLLVDEFTEIEVIKKSEFLPVDYNLTRLSRLPKLLRNYEPEQDPPEGILADVMAIPVQDLGQNENEKSPRKIKIMDDSDYPITWTLWAKDRTNDDAIGKIMGKPILIRNGIVPQPYKFSNGGIEIRKELNAIRIDFENDGALANQAKKLLEWYENRKNGGEQNNNVNE